MPSCSGADVVQQRRHAGAGNWGDSGGGQRQRLPRLCAHPGLPPDGRQLNATGGALLLHSIAARIHVKPLADLRGCSCCVSRVWLAKLGHAFETIAGHPMPFHFC